MLIQTQKLPFSSWIALRDALMENAARLRGEALAKSTPFEIRMFDLVARKAVQSFISTEISGILAERSRCFSLATRLQQEMLRSEAWRHMQMMEQALAMEEMSISLYKELIEKIPTNSTLQRQEETLRYLLDQPPANKDTREALRAMSLSWHPLTGFEPAILQDYLFQHRQEVARIKQAMADIEQAGMDMLLPQTFSELLTRHEIQFMPFDYNDAASQTPTPSPPPEPQTAELPKPH